MQLGVCWYPEQWPEPLWAGDAQRVRGMGLAWVRIGEFSWSTIEPEPGRLDWHVLDTAVGLLHEQGLKVVMCTPTATPPKWLVDGCPDILPMDEHGRPRRFGSRRHYCFSSPGYRSAAARIVRLMAERYGSHPAVAAWQTDNEYGCHDTVLSYTPAARDAFRRWLAQRHGSIEALNAAWGTAFWSQRYRGFDEIDPPAATVTEAHPAHRLDWRRFSSDQVVAFNRRQVQVLRAHSPGRPVLHNYMGFFTEFDHHAVSRDLDIAAWDSYPLGFTLDRADLDEAEQRRWLRSGHPDIPAFHHDLYRGMCGGRWWVMEQQPGPVNWAPWNPAPADGMVRLWTWQAFAHGAEVVSYFRWRQAPVAQEQMHAGLRRPDDVLDTGGAEAEQVAGEVAALSARLPLAGLRVQPRVALLFDYESHWMGQIQPQGAGYSVIHECFRAYAALRGLGLDVDVLPPDAPLQRHALVVLPAQLHVPEALAAALQAGPAHCVVGPRGGSKTAQLSIPHGLPPGPLAALLGLAVTRVESLPPGVVEPVAWGVHTLRLQRWRERVELRGAEVEVCHADGSPVLLRHGRARYLAAGVDIAGWSAVLAQAAADAGLPVQPLPEGLRISRIGPLAVACNFADTGCEWRPDTEALALLGGEHIAPHGLAVWRLPMH